MLPSWAAPLSALLPTTHALDALRAAWLGGAGGIAAKCRSTPEQWPEFAASGQSPHVERLIGSTRRECPDHVIVLDERHVRRALREYFDHYYRLTRTHLSLAKDAPIPRPRSRRRWATRRPGPDYTASERLAM